MESVPAMKQPGTSLIYEKPICWDVMNILDAPHSCTSSGCDLPSKWENEHGVVYCGRHKKQGVTLTPMTPIYIRKVKEYTPFEIQTRLIRALDKYPQIYDADYIFIENQDDHNPMMKTIASSVFTYYTKVLYTDPVTPKLKHIRYISAKQKTTKVPVIGGAYTSTKKGSYAKRKDTSIEYCTRYLGEYHQERLSWFLTHRKKDDLADSYMMNKAALWQLQFDQVYPTLPLDRVISLCDHHSIPTKKENGRAYTRKQLLTAMKQMYIWVNPGNIVEEGKDGLHPTIGGIA
jgi:hypothetical protein